VRLSARTKPLIFEAGCSAVNGVALVAQGPQNPTRKMIDGTAESWVGRRGQEKGPRQAMARLHPHVRSLFPYVRGAFGVVGSPEMPGAWLKAKQIAERT
jgi:hypothetical protein